MGYEEKLIGAVVSLIAMCSLLIRYVVKRKQDPVQETSSRRLARLRALQERERESRLHQHFKDYHEFKEFVRRSVTELGFKAAEMEKDVTELRQRLNEEMRTNIEYRESILKKLAHMEGAARAFASYARDAQRTLSIPILIPDGEE